MLRSRLRADDGFSLVEILVVILIIGILAAIALPAFLNQRSKAQDAHAKTSATTAAKAMAVWQTEHDSFAGAAPADLVRIEPALGPGPRPGPWRPTRSTFTVTVDSRGRRRRTRSSAAATARSCAPARQPGVGSCAEPPTRRATAGEHPSGRHPIPLNRNAGAADEEPDGRLAHPPV